MIYLFGLLPLGAMVIAVIVDNRTRSGFGLGIFSFLLLVCNIVFLALINVVSPPSPPDRSRIGYGFLVIFYFTAAVYFTLFLVSGALIEAGSARQWWWMVGCLAAGVVPVLVVATTALPLPFWKHTDAAGVVQNVGYIGVLLAPTATALAYSITRIIHSVAPARQAALPNTPAR